MNNQPRIADVLRDGITQLLSSDEVTRLHSDEPRPQPKEGEEYIDLDQLHFGVRLAMEMPPPKGNLLARSAVHKDTWTSIIVLLTTPNVSPDNTDDYVITPRNA